MTADQAQPAWPVGQIDVAAVKTWMTEVLPGVAEVVGPVAVYRSNPWGVTARFIIVGDASRSDVVFKANFLPQGFTGGAIYDVLARHCRDDVPELLAWVDEPGRRWTLFRVFEGPVVGTLGGLEPLLAVACALARIQTAAAELPASDTLLLPRVPVERMFALFDDLLLHVERWLHAERKLGGLAAVDPFNLPVNGLERLQAARPLVAAWTDELSAGGWPLSVHHVDLHVDNAVLQPNGRALIYDWEEADIGFPFYSLDKLLMATADRSGAGDEEAGRIAEVRAAYLRRLPWKTQVERERAFEVALRLSPIRYASADVRFAAALGWDPAEPVARWLALAFQRWDDVEI